MTGAVVSTLKLLLTVTVLPAASAATTAKVCAPSARVELAERAQVLVAAPSQAHETEARLVSVAVKKKVTSAVEVACPSAGPASIATPGSVLSNTTELPSVVVEVVKPLAPARLA